ncbi:hypothetical protein SynWH8103_01308 [Synechococcus sp. WH 8103]|nr:hypothetical protein SynWH8103_01308 [Synechococcus sp. WH 8103]
MLRWRTAGGRARRSSRRCHPDVVMVLKQLSSAFVVSGSATAHLGA